MVSTQVAEVTAGQVISRIEESAITERAIDRLGICCQLEKVTLTTEQKQKVLKSCENGAIAALYRSMTDLEDWYGITRYVFRYM